MVNGDTFNAKKLPWNTIRGRETHWNTISVPLIKNTIRGVAVNALKGK